MASINNRPNGRRWIQFTGADGKRHTVRLGKVPSRSALAVKVKVEDLVSASITGHSPSDETSRWLAGLDDRLRDKLAQVGLASKTSKLITLGAFLDDYAERRTDVKATTRLCYARSIRHLIGYFGSSKLLATINRGDATFWRLYLAEQKLADNTIRRSCGLARQFFTQAVNLGIIASNPFSHLVAAVTSNRVRDYFVSREEAAKVLGACPDHEWRLSFALARYGGLRVPSEPLRLRWQDIDWSGGRMTVSSPKTEHHPGHESRIAPIFPELLPYLREAFEQADEGSEYCITRYRTAGCNLRTQLHRIIKQAGLVAWPKLWQNLRATRETELADQFPAHVVSGWIGNSVAVAAKHYLQITDEHFRKATQNPTQQPAESGRNAPQPEPVPEPVTVVTSAGCETLRQKTTPCEIQGASSEGRYRTRACDLTGVIRTL